MLGHKLVQALSGSFDVSATLRGDFEKYEKFRLFDKGKVFERIDAENEQQLRSVIKNNKPDVVINAIGIIKQIPAAKNVIETLTINSILPHKLSELTNEYNFRLITISTDCVFRGEKGNYYETDISDATDLYGKSKNLGEVIAGNCLTLRTSIIGRELTGNHSLVEWFLSNRGKKVKGFVNAIYTGFPTIVFAEIIAAVISDYPKLQGLYHISSDPINKYELLKLINEKFKSGIKIEPETEFVIDRSLNSSKFRSTTGYAPPDWEKMIEMMANDPTPYDDWKV